jgi:hypothetical protein
MADQKSDYSRFVQAVAGDGTTVPDVRMLRGWLGASGQEGRVRLYLDASLGTFVDVSRDAILYKEEVSNSHPAGAQTVWVKGDAQILEGGSALSRAARFLSGPVQQDFLGGGQYPQTIACLTLKPGCEAPGRLPEGAQYQARVSGPGWTCYNCGGGHYSGHPAPCPTSGPCTGFAAERRDFATLTCVHCYTITCYDPTNIAQCGGNAYAATPAPGSGIWSCPCPPPPTGHPAPCPTSGPCTGFM